jgi:hypothetical protein
MPLIVTLDCLGTQYGKMSVVLWTKHSSPILILTVQFY